MFSSFINRQAPQTRNSAARVNSLCNDNRNAGLFFDVAGQQNGTPYISQRSSNTRTLIESHSDRVFSAVIWDWLSPTSSPSNNSSFRKKDLFSCNFLRLSSPLLLSLLAI